MNAIPLQQIPGALWLDYRQQFSYRESRRTSDLFDRSHGSILSRDLERQTDSTEGYLALLNQVSKDYVLPSDSSVLDFLMDHRPITQLLLEAAPILKQHFGDTTIFRLKAPLDESGTPTLYAVVMWPGEILTVRDALARFDDEWWMAQLPLASGDLTITYELV